MQQYSTRIQQNNKQNVEQNTNKAFWKYSSI